MSGINRVLNECANLLESRKSSGIKCAFLSYQKEDK